MTGANQVHYLFADHLGSSSVSYRSDGGQTVTQRYYPWGTVRSGSGNALPTGYTYTGQLDTGVGLMVYGVRLYDAALARFIQPDTIVPEPGNPQALNRYSYVLNNPLRYTDPTGHFTDDAIKAYLQNVYGNEWQMYWDAWWADEAWWSFIATAQANDIFAQGTQLYMFVGTGEVELTGVGVVWTGETPKPRFVQSHVVNDFFLGSYGVRVSNLIRPMPAGGYELVSTMPVHNYSTSSPYGALKSSVALQYHQVEEAEARANHALRTLGITAAVTGGTWALGATAAAALVAGAASPFLEIMAGEFLDYGLPDFGTSAGDMRFYLATDIGSMGPYRGGSTSTTLMWGRERWK